MKNHFTSFQPKYRSDIDGLRAIAVLSVVIFHMFPSLLKGGFVGVDIFFVISGFLISSIILANLKRRSFSLIDFYGHRIQRIFPALILVLVSCLCIGWFLLFSNEYIQLAKHTAGATTFISNFILWKESGYFDIQSETKPLLHLWSLGIEEQFYLIWPLFLFVAFKKRLNLLITLTMAIALSFVVNIQGVSKDQIATFYSPQTRFWELMIGGLLAQITVRNNYSEKFKILKHNILGFTGMLILIYTLIEYNKTIVYPGWKALWPVLASILIIASPRSYINQYILSNRILRFFGLISFPLYLWHWPLLSFATIIEGGAPGLGIRIGIFIISIILAWLTYKYIEVPIRKNKVTKIKIILLTGLLIIIGILSLSFIEKPLKSDTELKIELKSSQIGWNIPVGKPENIKYCNEIFPERKKFVSKKRDDNFCIVEKKANPNVLLIGDSLNLSLFPGLMRNDEFNIAVLSASAAAPFYNTRTTETNDTIREFNYKLTNQALDYAINHEEVKIVLLSFFNGDLLTDKKNQFKIINLSSHEEKNYKKIFTESLKYTVTKLLEKNKKIIFVLPNPRLSFDIESCLKNYRPIKISKPQECNQQKEYHLIHGGEEYRKWVYEGLKEYPMVGVFDPADILCDEKNCWAMKDGQILYRDRGHLSEEGSRYISEKLLSIIRS